MTRSTFDDAHRTAFADRLREVRTDLVGKRGSQELADKLGIPVRTWANYESGIVVPAEIVLRLQVLSSVSARWLLTGEGEKYHSENREYIARYGIN
jgi:transcriptional regulator with XRE-family HTH domain